MEVESHIICEKHPGYRHQYIQVNDLDANSQIFICCACIDELDIFEQKNFLLI